MNEAINVAATVPFGTAPARAAMDLCVFRGIDPNAYAPRAPIALTNWQWIIAETILERTLRQQLGMPF